MLTGLLRCRVSGVRFGKDFLNTDTWSRQRSCLKTGFLLMVCLILAGCGYRFAGGGELPGGIKTLSIGVFENRTSETGMETWIANDLINQFIRFDSVRLTDAAIADATLTGKIVSVRSDTIAHSTPNTPAERRIQVTLDVKLTSAGGEVLWSVDGLSAYETYEFQADKSGTEKNKKSALATLSSRVAERIYYQLTDNF